MAAFMLVSVGVAVGAATGVVTASLTWDELALNS